MEEDDGVDGGALAPTRRLRWGAVGGLAALGYVVGVAADALLLAADGGTYTDVHRRLDGLGWRLVLVVVLVGALGHLLDGTRRLVVDGRRRPQLDAAARRVVAFLLPALGLPLAAVVVWPALGWSGA